MPFANYKIEEKPFSRGGFGEVFMCTRKLDGKECVVKKALVNFNQSGQNTALNLQLAQTVCFLLVIF